MDYRKPDVKGTDAIDSFAAEILKNPERADMLKARLRQSLGVAAANEPAARARPSVVPDLEEFWDNVPI